MCSGARSVGLARCCPFKRKRKDKHQHKHEHKHSGPLAPSHESPQSGTPRASADRRGDNEHRYGHKCQGSGASRGAMKRSIAVAALAGIVFALLLALALAGRLLDVLHYLIG